MPKTNKNQVRRIELIKKEIGSKLEWFGTELSLNVMT